MRGGVRGAVRCVAVFALAAGAVACGGSDDDAADTETESVAVEEIAVSVLADPEVIGLVEVIAGDVGDDMVFEAVALALDRGYSVEQLSEVGGTGAVSADGVIVGVDPVGESFGVLLVDDAVASFGRTADATVPVEDLAEAIAPVHDDFNWRVDLDEDLQNNVVLAGVLVTLVEMGYSFDQVVEGVVFGELSVRYATELKSYTTGSELVGIGCVTLADGTGSVVVPSRDPVPGTVTNAYRCGQAARNGQLLTTEEAADRIRADRAGEDTAESTPDTGAAGEGGDDGGDVRVFSGAFDLEVVGLGSADTVVANGGELVAGADLTGTVKAYGESPAPLSQPDDPERVCGGMQMVLQPGMVTIQEDGTYSGSLDFFIAFEDGLCPPEPEFFGPIPATVVARIAGTTLTVTITVTNEDDGEATELIYVATEVTD